MAKIIDVPGMGHVEFPDDMSDDQIVQAIQRTNLSLAKQVISEPPSSLEGKLAMGAKPTETFPQYAGRAVKEMAIPMVTTAAGGTLGVPGAMAGSAFGEFLNQTTGVYPRSVIPEANVNLDRVTFAAAAPAIIPGLVKVAQGVRAVGKKIGENVIADKFVNAFLKKHTAGSGDKLARELVKPNPFHDWVPAVPNASVPLYPSTAAEKLVGLPEASPLQAAQQMVAKSTGGVSGDFGQRILDQRAAIQAARASRAADIGPRLDTALEKANFGKQIPLLEAMIEQRLKGATRFAPPDIPAPAKSDALRSAVELHAPYTPPVIETAAQKIGKSVASELYGDAQADANAMRALQVLLKQQGFKPLSINPIIKSIDKQLADPKVGTLTTATNVLGKVKNYLVAHADESGLIPAEAIQNARRKELGNFINQAMKETGTWDKKQAAGIANSVQSILDDAIESSGGRGWNAAMADWSKRSQDIADVLEKFTTRYKPDQPTSIQGMTNIAQEGGKHLFPDWLSRPITGAKWLQKLIQDRMEPKIDRRMADLFLGTSTPDGISHEALANLLRTQPPSRYNIMVQEILKHQAPLAAGAATQTY